MPAADLPWTRVLRRRCDQSQRRLGKKERSQGPDDTLARYLVHILSSLPLWEMFALGARSVEGGDFPTFLVSLT